MLSFNCERRGHLDPISVPSAVLALRAARALVGQAAAPLAAIVGPDLYDRRDRGCRCNRLGSRLVHRIALDRWHDRRCGRGGRVRTPDMVRREKHLHLRAGRGRPLRLRRAKLNERPSPAGRRPLSVPLPLPVAVFFFIYYRLSLVCVSGSKYLIAKYDVLRFYTKLSCEPRPNRFPIPYLINQPLLKRQFSRKR